MRSFKWLLAALMLLLESTAALKGDNNEGSGFTYPVEKGLTFYEKDSVNVSWTSNFNSARLLLFCWEGEKEDVLTMKANWTSVPANDGFSIIFIDFETTAKNCWFNLRDNEKRPEDEGANGVNSAGFGLSRSERSQTTLGLQGPPSTTMVISATSETAASTNTVPPSDAPATTTPAGSNSGDSSEGLSTGAKAGIGIGVSLGVLGLLALGAAFWIVKRRKKTGQGRPLIPEKDGTGVEAFQHKSTYETPSRPIGPPQELPG